MMPGGTAQRLGVGGPLRLRCPGCLPHQRQARFPLRQPRLSPGQVHSV